MSVPLFRGVDPITSNPGNSSSSGHIGRRGSENPRRSFRERPRSRGFLSPGRGAGVGRFRGYRGRGRPAQGPSGHQAGPDESLPSLDGLAITGTSQPSTLSTQDPDSLVLRGSEADADNSDTSSEFDGCFICASPIVYSSISPCNHRTCHICTLRMRALYKTKACAHCRKEVECTIFTDQHEKSFSDFQDFQFTFEDKDLGIRFTGEEIYQKTVRLLRFNCPHPDCDTVCSGWQDLHRHVNYSHHKVMCELCTIHKKVFTHEQELFTKRQLLQHERSGNDLPGSADQTGFIGHPECGFCQSRFYSDDELFSHCREKHERCHICDRAESGARQEYYLDYNSLEQHFRAAHFICLDPECLERKFVVFESEIDLKAHQLEQHLNCLSKDARRDARLVNLSGFAIRQPFHQPNRHGDPGRRRDRERAGNNRALDPQPSSGITMRRDERAFQRQVAIQGYFDQNTHRGASHPSVFNANHESTSHANASSSAAEASNRQQPASIRNSGERLDSISRVRNGTSDASEQQTRQQRLVEVVSRVTSMLKSQESRLEKFHQLVLSFRDGELTGQQLVQEFFVLFKAPPTEVGKVVMELAEIFEIAEKRDELFLAWNNWRASQEGSSGPASSNPGPSQPRSTEENRQAGRVLKAKPPTKKTTVDRRTPWATSSAAPSSSVTPSSMNPVFPTLTTALRATRNQSSHPTPWLSGSNSSNSRPSTQPPISGHNPVRTTSSGLANPDPNSFPSLPRIKNTMPAASVSA